MNGTTYRWLLLALILLVVFNIGPARADDAVVATCDESSFDAALATAALNGGGTITFTCSGTIPITTTKSILSGTISIDGGGVITLDGGGSNQIFTVDTGATLNLNGLNLTNAGDRAITANNLGTTVTITNSSLAGNTVAGDGGAILAINGVNLTITNSTFSNNSALGNGGAIYSSMASVAITNSTFVGNSSGTDGGALSTGLGSIDVANSVFWNNTASGNGPTCIGTLNTSGVNYFGDTSDCVLNVVIGSNVVGTDPQLSTLYNGTYVPLAVSPLIDAATGCSVGDDQFSTTRPQGADCEVGAVERPDILASPATLAVTEGGATDTLTFTLGAAPFDFVQFFIEPADTDCQINGISGQTQVVLDDANWDTGAAFTVSAVDDTDVEGAHTCAITVNAATSGDLRFDNTDPDDLTANVTDNEVAPDISIADAAIEEGDTGTTTLTFTVTRSGNLGVESSVDWATADSSAMTADNDYTAANGTITFLANDDIAEINIDLTGDTTFEPDETFFIDLSNPVAANITDNQAVGTIRNDDTQPSLSINDVTQNEGDGGVTTFTFTVTLSNPTSDTVTVDWATADSSATTADGDYTDASGQVSLTASTTTAPIVIDVQGDTNLESDEQFLVNLSNPANATITDGEGVGTITNDDGTLPTITIADEAVVETDGVTSVTLTLTRDVTTVASAVQVDTADDTATAGADYTAITGQIVNFAIGEAQQTVDITINGDNVAEGDEQFFVNLSNATVATIGDNQAVVTITEDDTPSVTVNPTPIAISEAGPTSANYTLTLETAPVATVTILLTYDTTQCTVTTVNPVVFNAGQVGPQTVTVLAVDDAIPETSPHPCDIVHAATSTDPNYNAIPIAWTTANITDNDLTLTPASLPNGGTGVAYSQNLTVGNGTAPYTIGLTVGSLPPGLTFTDNGNGTATITGTPTTAGSYPFTISATDAGVGAVQVDYTIGITDSEISFDAVDSVTVNKDESDNVTAIVTLTVRRTGDTTGTSSVTYSTSDGTATGGSDYGTLNPTVLDFAAGEDFKTIQVTVINDTVDEDDETFTVNLSAPTGATLGAATSTITIVDDDAPPTVSISDVTLNEGNSGATTFTFSATLSAASERTITVDYATADNTATVADSDYVAASGTLTFNALDVAESISVTVNGDTAVETDEQFFVNLANATNATIVDAQGLGTIVNDDSGVTVIVAPASLPNGTVGTSYSQTISASGGTAPYTFNVSAGALPDGLNLSGADLTGTPTTANTYNFTITATDANSVMGQQSYTVVIQPTGGVTITVDPPSLPGGTVGTSYSRTFSASGGTAPYTFSVSAGTLPPGLTLSGANLTDAPTTANTYNFTITATDANSNTGTRAYTVIIAQALVVVNPTSLPVGAVGQGYSQTFSASGGTGNYSFSVIAGALPPGLTLTGATLTGTPTVANTYNFTVQAQDTLGNRGSRPYSLVISPAAGGVIAISPDVLPNGVLAQVYNQTISASGGAAPFTFGIVSGSLPTGLTLAPGGQISGTPTTEGSFSFTILVTDSAGRTSQRAYTITVTATGGETGTGDTGGTVTVQPTLAPLTLSVSNEVAGLAMRTGPYLGATLIGGATPGVSYTATAQSTDDGGFIWYYITDGTISGWASGRFLVFNRDPGGFPAQGSIFDTIDDAPDVGVVGQLGTFTDMRRRPSPRTNILMQLDPGTQLAVIGRTRQNGGNFWYHVRYNGQVGWISGSLVIIRGNIEDVPIR